jgi:hypothetical protein
MRIIAGRRHREAAIAAIHARACKSFRCASSRISAALAGSWPAALSSAVMRGNRVSPNIMILVLGGSSNGWHMSRLANDTRTLTRASGTVAPRSRSKARRSKTHQVKGRQVQTTRDAWAISMFHSTLMVGGEILLAISLTIFVGALIATAWGDRMSTKKR